jgi:predicted HAD superfamily Cof-like phosphohydrolase
MSKEPEDRDHGRRTTPTLPDLPDTAGEAVGRIPQTLTAQVREFHTVFNYPIRDVPALPPDEEMWFRVRRIAEEYEELVSAVIAKDIIAIADALGDLDYVIEGTRLSLGIPRHAVADVIHDSNMAKAKGIRDESGKPLKPEGWKPPDIEGVLRRFGFKKEEVP